MRKRYNYNYRIIYKVCGVYEYSCIITTKYKIKSREESLLIACIRDNGNLEPCSKDSRIDIIHYELLRKFRVG